MIMSGGWDDNNYGFSLIFQIFYTVHIWILYSELNHTHTYTHLNERLSNDREEFSLLLPFPRHPSSASHLTFLKKGHLNPLSFLSQKYVRCLFQFWGYKLLWSVTDMNSGGASLNENPRPASYRLDVLDNFLILSETYFSSLQNRVMRLYISTE